MGDYNQVSKQISDLIGGRSAQEQADTEALKNQYGYQSQYDTLQGIRRNVSDTEKALSDLPGQMQQRTAGSLVTSGQLGRLVNSETDPIAKNLAVLNKNQSIGEQSMNDINNLISQGQQSSRLNYTDKLSYLQNLQNQLFQAQEAAKARAAQQAAADAQARAQQDALNKYYASLTTGAGMSETPLSISVPDEQRFRVGGNTSVPTQSQNGDWFSQLLSSTPLGVGVNALGGYLGGGAEGAKTSVAQNSPLVYQGLKSIKDSLKSIGVIK